MLPVLISTFTSSANKFVSSTDSKLQLTQFHKIIWHFQKNDWEIADLSKTEHNFVFEMKVLKV